MQVAMVMDGCPGAPNGLSDGSVSHTSGHWTEAPPPPHHLPNRGESGTSQRWQRHSVQRQSRGAVALLLTEDNPALFFHLI
ncbi:unnamed protein product [Arctogadus glacialis]